MAAGHCGVPADLRAERQHNTTQRWRCSDMTQHFLPQVSAAPGPPTNHKPCLSCLLHRHWDVRGVLELTTRVSLHVKLVKSQSGLLLLPLLLLTRHRAAAGGGGWRRGRVEQGGEPLALHKNTIITPLQLHDTAAAVEPQSPSVQQGGANLLAQR